MEVIKINAEDFSHLIGLQSTWQMKGSQEVQEDSPDVCVIHSFSESIATALQILSLGHDQLCTAMETLCCKLQCIRRSYNGSEF